MSPELKLSKVKAALVLQNPFFSALCCSLPVRIVKAAPFRAATNGMEILFREDFVNESSHDELLFTLCHEVLHVALAHCIRIRERQPYRWNVATDFIINDMLISDGIGKPPPSILINPAIVQQGGGTADGVYNLIPEPQGNNGGGGYSTGSGAGGDGDGENNGQGSLFDECQPMPGNEAEIKKAEADIKVRVAQAHQVAKMCGKAVSPKLERIIDFTLKPKVPWQDVLRNFVTSKARTEYSYARPNRRFTDLDYLLPSLTGESMGTLVVAVDCSGSIGDRELSEFAAEINAIKEDVKPARLHVVYFDTHVCHHDVFSADDPLQVAPHGGGGTAFSPIFRFIEDEEIEPICCVVLTDLCCDDFGPPPDYPVLWVTTTKGRAPWGEIVEMNPTL